jgi:uncharacterized protein (DUF3084 family)
MMEQERQVKRQFELLHLVKQEADQVVRNQLMDRIERLESIDRQEKQLGQQEQQILERSDHIDLLEEQLEQQEQQILERSNHVDVLEQQLEKKEQQIFEKSERSENTQLGRSKSSFLYIPGFSELSGIVQSVKDALHMEGGAAAETEIEATQSMPRLTVGINVESRTAIA